MVTADTGRIAMRAWVRMVAVGLSMVLSSWHPAAGAPPPLDLTRQDPVSRGGVHSLWGRPGERVAIGGKLFAGYLWMGRGRNPRGYDDGWAIWAVPAGCRVLEAVVGVADDSTADGPATFTISVDGEVVKSVKVAPRARAVSLSVPVREESSLRLHVDGFGGVFAEPRLLAVASTKHGPTPVPVPPGGPGSPSAPFAVDPKDLKTLADSLRSQVDADPAIAKRIGDGQVAVATFSLIDIPAPSVAQNVAEDLTTAMIKARFQVVERGQLDKVLGELRIQNLGLVDPKTAQTIGQLSGCEVILLGSISDRGQFVVVNARMMETATGKSVVAEQVEMRKLPISRGD
jgi:TolB-like protein